MQTQNNSFYKLKGFVFYHETTKSTTKTMIKKNIKVDCHKTWKLASFPKHVKLHYTRFIRKAIPPEVIVNEKKKNDEIPIKFFGS